MIRQRRRWISGTLADGGLLPMRYRPLYFTRIIAWAFSPLVPFLVFAAALFPATVPTMGWYRPISLALFGMLFVYIGAGLLGYRKHPILWPVFVVATPIAFVAHSIGALWGIVRPVATFEVTEKVAPEVIEQYHEELAAGDLTDHDGTERLIREDEGAFATTVFDD